MEPHTVAPDGTQAPSPTAWIDAYVAWASKRSPLTPLHFHEGIAFSLTACAIAGRVCAQTPQGKVYPNLYTLLLGKTSVYAKSVALDLSQEVAEAARISDRIISSVFTPESVVGELAGDTPTNLKDLNDELQDRWRLAVRWGAQRTFRLDEAGMFFNALSRDYNAGFADLWMKLYDCPQTVERTTYKHGLHVIQQPVVSCLFATTPAGIAPILRNQGMWLNGFWPRWNFCVGGGYTDMIPSIYSPPPEELVQPLKLLGDFKLSAHSADNPLVVPIEEEVIRAYEAVLEGNRRKTMDNEDGYMEAVYGRLHTKRLKLAIILASLALPDKEIRVTLPFWDATKRFVTQMELDIVEAIRQVRKSDKATLEDRIIRYLKRNGKTATFRDVGRFANLSAEELDRIVGSLVNLGYCKANQATHPYTITLLDEQGGIVSAP